MERVKRLRGNAVEPSVDRLEFYYLFYKKFGAYDAPDLIERYGEAFYEALAGITPCISPEELIVGKSATALTAQQSLEWESLYKPEYERALKKTSMGQDSHMAIDYELVLQAGINGILDKVEGYLETCEPEKKAFYEICRKCLQAVVCHAENYAKEAERLAALMEDESRKAELLEIARICRKVPAQPAESFYEAVQSVHFVSHCLSMNPFRHPHPQFQLGHPDRYLWPYYEADRKSGRIDRERAQLLLDCLGIQINHRVIHGLSCGYMVGGRDENGNIVANELTWMCMQVIDDIQLVYPSVGLCWTEEMDDFYLEKACEILSHGRSHPAIFNDDVISRGLRYYGVPEPESHNYIHSTCVEITPVAASNVWVATPYENMAQLLLDVLDREYESFEDLLGALYENLDTHIKNNFEEKNLWRQWRAKYSINPLLSCFVNDCLALGTDIEAGGARYNWIMPSFVGMANLVDSLYVIKKVVFEGRELSMAQLRKILDDNFEGNEALRHRFLNQVPKYGNDMDEVDQYFVMLIDHIVKECEKYKPIFRNGLLIPSVFCWIKHAQFGKVTGATPDGRPAGFPLGDGSGPCQGREMNGPTASILSATKWSHSELIGGVAVNMKFSKKVFGDRSFANMLSLIKTYLKRGGFEMQINVVDKDTLLKARKNPEQYRDLVVRIGGYSDYFVTLSPEMQEEVILRTEHEV